MTGHVNRKEKKKKYKCKKYKSKEHIKIFNVKREPSVLYINQRIYQFNRVLRHRE